MNETQSDKAVGRSVSLPISFWQKIDALPQGRSAYFNTLVGEDLAKRAAEQIPDEVATLLHRCRDYEIDVKTVLHTALVEEQCSSIPAPTARRP